jgi:hypothetical protein
MIGRGAVSCGSTISFIGSRFLSLLLLGRLVEYGIEVARMQGDESLVIAVEGQILQGM